MKKLIRILAFLLAILMIPLAASAEYRTFFEQETEPFGEDEELLILRIAGTMGGDCMLLSYGSENMLIDTGEPFFFEFFQKMMTEANAGSHVDALFNSHPHRDHLNGLFQMLEEGYTFGKIYTAYPHDYTDGTVTVVQKEMIEAAEKAEIPVVDVKNGDVFEFGPAEITVIRLPDDSISRDTSTNDQSAMIMIRYGECSLLLTGDVEHAQSELAKLNPNLKADIMKAPHHGLGGINRSFLKDVDPEFIFITNGSYDTKTALETMQNNGYNRYLCATWGEITLRCNGVKWIISQEAYPEYARHVENMLKRMVRK